MRELMGIAVHSRIGHAHANVMADNHAMRARHAISDARYAPSRKQLSVCFPPVPTTIGAMR